MYSSAGQSYYNAFQAILKVRRSAVNAQVSYTLQQGRDMANLANNVTGGDLGTVPGTPGSACFFCPMEPNLALQQLSVYFTWDLPFLQNYHNWASKILGGWQISSLFTVSSGSPLDVAIGQDWNYSGGNNGAERLNLTRQVQYPKQQLANGNIQWFGVGNTTPQSGQRGPFALPPHSQIGNLAFNQLIGPGSLNLNTALMKTFHITERKYFQIRVEAQNILNHPTLSNPDTSFFDSNFGQINYRYGNRLLQVGLKYDF